MILPKFNQYDWHTYRLDKRDQFPTIPHFQALVFGTRSESIAPYDKGDSWSSTSVPEVIVYVFHERKDLDLFVAQAAKSDLSFVFYAVPEAGKFSIKVEVGV